MADKQEKDGVTGVDTTGHEWDGIKELNNPAPRWWLWVFFITVIWAGGYWVVYPAWPTFSSHTKGTVEWTQYTKLKQEQTEIATRRGQLADKMRHTALADIQNDPELYAFAQAAGKTMFRENCSACHGTGAEGRRGYPNLNDDDWLWGGDAQSIYRTLKTGIRSDHEQSRESQMPAFGDMLKQEEIAQVSDYVLSLSGKAQASPQGEALFKQNCESCHGNAGHGGREFGAPNLADAIWLYGGEKTSVMAQISQPRHGVMPSWETRLPDETLKALTIYVHSLGGGESTPAKE